MKYDNFYLGGQHAGFLLGNVVWTRPDGTGERLFDVSKTTGAVRDCATGERVGWLGRTYF